MKTPALTLVETPPASPEAVARLMAAARAGGLALSHDIAERAAALATDCRAVAALKDAVPVGVLEQSARMAEALDIFAANVAKLAR